MTDKQIDNNLNFQRAMHVLNVRVDTPEYLLALWRLVKNPDPYPAVERSEPWFKGFEYILKKNI